MAHALVPVSRGYLLAGAAVAAGLYAIHDRDEATPQPEPRVASVMPMRPSAPRPMPTIAIPITGADVDDADLEAEEDDIEAVRGHAAIEDIAEFAMVFDVDGTSYLRLSTELRAKARGKARLVIEHDWGVHAVVAPVTLSAMPDELRKWNGRSVLVNGTCQARVIGFAEVSRVSGDPPGSEEYYWYEGEDGEIEPPATEPTWTIENITADNVTLAAKLDGCSGSWARSTEYETPQIAMSVTEPELETNAIADLLAKNDIDPIQDDWKLEGGEGDWRDAVDVEATTYEHPATGEKWIFVQAYKAGGCGDAGMSAMAAYRVGKSGKMHRFTDLDFGGELIEEVVDLDGDGQPELILGGGDSSTELVDLANTRHDSISVPQHHHGCGC